MGNLTSKQPLKTTGQITESDRAVLTLKAQRKKLTAQRARTDAQVAREGEVIRELLRTHKKERALLALKRKKLQEKQLEHIDAWLLNVESLLLDIEAAKRSNLLVDALKSGNDAIKEMQAAMPLSEIETLMDESAEARAHEQALARMLGESFDPADEDAVLQELDALEEQALAAEVDRLPNAPPVPDRTAVPAAEEEALDLPAAPTHEVAMPVTRVAELA